MERMVTAPTTKEHELSLPLRSISLNLSNKVVRFTKKDKSLVEPLTIIDGIPGSSIYKGRRIKFGPDSFLYILMNNRDGREIPSAEDEQIIRINPEKL